jgi:hypothetical protein
MIRVDTHRPAGRTTTARAAQNLARRNFSLDFPGESRHSLSFVGIPPMYRRKAMRINWCHYRPEFKATTQVMRLASGSDLRHRV